MYVFAQVVTPPVWLQKMLDWEKKTFVQDENRKAEETAVHDVSEEVVDARQRRSSVEMTRKRGSVVSAAH